MSRMYGNYGCSFLTSTAAGLNIFLGKKSQQYYLNPLTKCQCPNRDYKKNKKQWKFTFLTATIKTTMLAPLYFTECWLIWATTWQNQQYECAPSKDSDQPGHPPSLIRVFAVRMKKAWVLSYPLSAQRRLIRLGGCPGWSESSPDA